MGTVIATNASTSDIVRDVNLTLARALSVSPEWSAEAERFLGDTKREIERLEVEYELANAQLLQLRADQQATDHRCNDLISRIKDRLYNDIGRTRSDATFRLCYPDGVRTYTIATPTNKPAALRRNVRMLETYRHEQISPEALEEVTAQLLAAADEMSALNEQIAPQREEVRLIRAQFTAMARRGRTQLARLKKYWLALGVAEVDIHRMIPDRPRRAASDGDELDAAAV